MKTKKYFAGERTKLEKQLKELNKADPYTCSCSSPLIWSSLETNCKRCEKEIR